MNGPLSTLEQRLDDALHERADAMPARVESLPVPVAEPLRPPRRPLVWAVAAAAVVLAVATLVITRPFVSDSEPATPTPSTVSPPTTTRPSTSTTMPIAAPPTDAGAEVPLAPVDTENTQFLIRMQLRQTPAATPIAVGSPGLAPIVVNGACLMIAVAPTDGTGYQGSCASDPPRAFVAAVDTGANLTPTSKVYAAWVDVPEGTAYVTYAYGAERWWQRPFDGITYLATDANPKYGGEPLVARAFDPSGRQLGEITQTPIRAGGEWDWY